MASVSSPVPSVAAVILAAGASTRMGRPKQALAFEGKTLLRRIVDEALASSVSRVLVVLGAHAELLASELPGLQIEIVDNPGWADGMGTSVAAATRRLLALDPVPDAALFLLADQPLVGARAIDALLLPWRTMAAPIVASSVGGRLGAPALFTSRFFPELAALTGDRGARDVLRAHADVAVALPMPEAGVDVDTPEDYERLRAGRSAP